MCSVIVSVQVLLQCPRLQALSITGCSQLEVLMLWSEDITELDLTGGPVEPQTFGPHRLHTHPTRP
jgi:hypothetical protein